MNEVASPPTIGAATHQTKSAPVSRGALFNRRSVCYLAHLQVSHLQQAQGAHLHASHLQQPLHFSCAGAASTLPVRAAATNNDVRIAFMIFSLFNFNILKHRQLNQEKIGGRKSGESVRPEYSRSTDTTFPKRESGESKSDRTGSAAGDNAVDTQLQRWASSCAHPSHLQVIATVCF